MSKHLSNYLRTYRKRSGLAQHEFARLLGCAHGSKVSRYERGERAPTLATLIVYELLFRVCLAQMFRGQVEEAAREVRRRAQDLHRVLDARPKLTPALKRKLDFLVDVIYPPKKS